MAMINSGPIPGANMTSDTKNYPWRQPPKYADVNDAMDFLAKKITKFKVANGLLTMVELGIPVVSVAQVVLMQGVAEGMWTVDFALLLCGPLCRMIELICIGFDVDYELGIEEDMDDFNTADFFRYQQDLSTPMGMQLISQDGNDPTAPEQENDTVTTEAGSGDSGGGFASPPSQGQPADNLQGGAMSAMSAPNPNAKGAK